VLAEAPPPAAPAAPAAYPDGLVPVSSRLGEAPLAVGVPAAPGGGAPIAAMAASPAAADATARGLDGNRTPSVLGMSARQALALFARAGALARIQGTGFVVAQDPPPGTPLRAGDVHTLFLDDRAPAASGEARRAGGAPPPPRP
jgi:hypothetical protein